MKIQTKEAYLVTGWATEAVKGIAFTISVIDWGTEVKHFFSIDKGKTFKQYREDEVFYTVYDAQIKLSKETSSMKSYYEKQIIEANKQLEKIT